MKTYEREQGGYIRLQVCNNSCCFICHSTSEVTGTSLPENSAGIINDINQQTLLTLTNFFEKEQQQGNVSAENSPEVFANYLLNYSLVWLCQREMAAL